MKPICKLISALAFAAGAMAAQALELKPYDAKALAAAQQADKPVALHFHADWCPTCRSQEKALKSLASEAGLDLTVLVANYDQEKELKRHFNVRSQSTLVVLRGQQERARLVGDTSVDSIRSALKSGL